MQYSELEKFIGDIYSTSAENVFEKYPDVRVFRHMSNNKWFAIVMEVPKKRLGLEGDEPVTILNTKCDFILINSLLTEEGFHPAYHMNKAHWITSRLDGTIDIERLKGLIDISYDLTNVKREKKSKRTP